MRHTTYMAVLLAAGCASPPAAVEDDGHQLAVVAAPKSAQDGSLGRVYAAYRADTVSAERQRAYFQSFPGDYTALRKEFGFEEIDPDSTRFGDYYKQGIGMIGAFFQLDAIPPAELAAKAVGIARNGSWQEDGVGYFQLFLSRSLEQDPFVYLTTINGLPHAYQASFWKFYLDGPEAYPKEDAMRLRSQLAKEPRQLALLDSVLALPRSGH